MSVTTLSLSRPRAEPQTAARLALVGAGCGLAWSCAMRGWMMAVAGPESTVTWAGTFGGVLAPAAVVGGLLGWAEARRRAGRPPSGWLVASPVALGLAPLAVPGRGSRRRRIAAGVLGFAAVPGWWLAPPMTPDLDPAKPYGALVAMTFTALFVSLAAACAVPMRATTA